MKISDSAPHIKILFIGDVIGKPGRWALSQIMPYLEREKPFDFAICNVENAAGGFGLTEEIASTIFSYGINCFTSGNHLWDRKESHNYLAREENLLRPANYPPAVPGFGSKVFTLESGRKIGVLNLQGRVYMKPLDCPFTVARKEVELLRKETNIIIVDFHAEATSEKQAMGWYLDSQVSAVIGTHTHVQSADEKILPGGSAFITDAGMTGPHESVIGMEKDVALYRFLTGLHKRFPVAEGEVKFCGAMITVNSLSGKATNIERLRIDLPMRR